MSKDDIAAAVRQMQCLIKQAEKHRQNGYLLKAAMLTKKADEILLAWQKKTPGSKILHTIRNEKETCWNKIIHDMINNIHIEPNK